MTDIAPSPLDSNVLLRHLTDEPREQAERARAFIGSAPVDSLLLLDLHVAELVYVLGTVYGCPRDEVATMVRGALALPSIIVEHDRLVRRTLDLFEERHMHWADAYLVAAAEDRGLPTVVSFDQFDATLKGLSIRREEP